MRSLRFATLAALALAASVVTLGACAREVTLAAPPVVHANADMEVPLQDTILLGATATGSSDIVSYDWLVVSSPSMNLTSVSSVSDSGDVAILHTQSVPGLYVVGVTATDKDGRVSDPDFVNIRMFPASELLKISVSCQAGCSADSSGNLIVDELSSATFVATVTSGAAEGFSWSASLSRAATDKLTDEVQVVQNSDGSATISVPRVTADAKLAVFGTAYASGQSDAVDELDLTVKNSKDEPPVIALAWKIPGLSPHPSHVLPGDAIYLQASVTDPNDGQVPSCSFSPPSGLAAEVHTISSDPCRLLVFPLEGGGTLSLKASAVTLSPFAKSDASVDIEVAGFVLEKAGPALSSVALSLDGSALATSATADFYVYDSGAATPAGTKVKGTLANGSAAAFSGTAQAVLGFASSSSVGEYDFNQAKALADVPLSGASAPLPSATRSMASGTNGKVWLALDHGLAVFDPWTDSPLAWLATGGISASAIAWGPSWNAASEGGYVWYAESSDVYCQSSEAYSSWSTSSKGTKVGTVKGYVNLAALSLGTSKTWDLWAAAMPSGAANFGALLLYQDVVDPASGSLQMNNQKAFFTQVAGGVSNLAVERDGAYEGDAWAVAGGSLVRVSRAPTDAADGKTLGTLDLSLTTKVDQKIKAVAVVGRRVVLATDQGLAVAQ